MTEVRVDNITDAAGTGKPDFEDGITYEGAALSALNTHEYSTSEPSSPKNGSIWYDSGTIKIYVNGDWYTVNLNASSSSGGIAWGGDRGVIATGTNLTTEIAYFDITTEGNTSDFGDITATRSNLGGTSNGTRGVFMGGYTSGGTGARNIMDYITFSTTGNATDFGDLTSASYYGNQGVVGDGTYGLWHLGYSGGNVNTIEYITVATTGNSSDFGDRTEAAYGTGGLSDATYGLFAGGNGYSTTIDYVTMASPGNASDFGDLTVGRKELTGASDSTRGVFFGGQGSSSPYPSVIDYVTVATTGNATDFGDFSTGEYAKHGAASSNGTRAVYGGAGWSVSGTFTYLDNRQEFVVIQTTGNSTDFGDLTTMRSEAAGASGAAA